MPITISYWSIHDDSSAWKIVAWQIDMISKDPKISVVMASYNGAATLPRAIESFRMQTYPAKELIVIDGGSSDKTREILRSYDEWISYSVSEPDREILDAWNKGLKHTTGDWVHFLGTDDYYYDESVFAKIVEFFRVDVLRRSCSRPR